MQETPSKHIRSEVKVSPTKKKKNLVSGSKSLLQELRDFGFSQNKLDVAIPIPWQHCLTGKQLREQRDHSNMVLQSSRLSTLHVSAKGWELLKAYARKNQDMHTN